MTVQPHPTSFGVFKPTGQVLMSFADAAGLDRAVQALHAAGFGAADITLYTPQAMREQAEKDVANASMLASLGQDLNLVKAQLALAQQGHHFVLVRAASDEQVQAVTAVALACHASRAQHYGRLVIEELVPVGQTTRQVAESPDRGLDTQSAVGDPVAADPTAIR